MLNATYLGHSGWLFESRRCRILVDPLLFDDFGRGNPGAQYCGAIWPPRFFSIDRFPSITAVMISHEHEDHFNLPSLNLLDRRIPIFISSRSSVAATTILSEMGFSVSELKPGFPHVICDMQVLPLSPDHTSTPNNDEWDVVGFFVRELQNGGSFFTNVDVLPTDSMIARVKDAAGDAQKILVFRDEYLAWSPLSEVNAFIRSEHYSERLSNGIEITHDFVNGHPLLASPGNTFGVSGAELCSVSHQTTFLTIPSQEKWPQRPEWSFAPSCRNYPPACGETEITVTDLQGLLSALTELAQFMYGGKFFRALYSLWEDELHNKIAGFVIVLVVGSDRTRYAFEYDASSCTFNVVPPGRALNTYVSGVECWATDLLALFRGDFEPRILTLGHALEWTLHPQVPRPFLHVIYPFFHPLRRPMQCLHAYRTVVNSLPVGRKIPYREDVIDVE